MSPSICLPASQLLIQTASGLQQNGYQKSDFPEALCKCCSFSEYLILLSLPYLIMPNLVWKMMKRFSLYSCWFPVHPSQELLLVLLDKHIQEWKTANLVCYKLDILAVMMYQEVEALTIIYVLRSIMSLSRIQMHRPAFKLVGAEVIDELCVQSVWKLILPYLLINIIFHVFMDPRETNPRVSENNIIGMGMVPSIIDVWGGAMIGSFVHLLLLQIQHP